MRTKTNGIDIERAMRDVFISVNEADSNGEAANLVDAGFAIARAIHDLADAVREQKKDESAETTHS